MQSKDRIADHDIPGKPLEVVGGDMSLYNKHYPYIVDYPTKF